jgi:hypothetical protein
MSSKHTATQKRKPGNSGTGMLSLYLGD